MKKLLILAVAVTILTLFSAIASAQQIYVANLSSAQEVPANATTGKGVCTVTLNAAETQINVNLTYSGLGTNAIAGHIHGPGAVGVNADVQINFTGVSGTSNTVTLNNLAITPAQVLQIRQGLAYVNIHTADNGAGEIRGQLKLANKVGDYDGDGRADIAVFRQSPNNVFYILNSLNSSLTALQFGPPGGSAFNCVGDYDGDGRTDISVTRDPGGSSNNLEWYILQSSNNTIRSVLWGLGGLFGDTSAPADYDGDGKADIAVWRASAGTFYVLQSSNGALLAQQWGSPTDTPVKGDFDKDGKSDFAVIRDASGLKTWYVLQSSNGALLATQWGSSGDTPVSGDFDRDGKNDFAVVRNSGGVYTWYILQSSSGALLTTQFGATNDYPLGLDTDGDGKSDFVAVRGLFSGSLVYWYIMQSSDGGFRAVQWGSVGDLPL